MKKQYNTPACKAIALRVARMLTASPQNTFGSDEGTIRYNPIEVGAEDAD